MSNFAKKNGCTLFGKGDRSPEKIDEFKIPKIFLRGALVWPHDNSLLIRVLGALYQMPSIYILISMCVYVVIEEKTDGAVEYMKCFGDIMGFLQNSMKHFFLYTGKAQVGALRKLVTEDFPAFETKANYEVNRKKRPFWPWLPTTVYALVTVASLAVCLITMNVPRDERTFALSFPKILLTNDLLFYTTLLLFYIAHAQFWFAYSSVDALFIVFTTLIEDKARTLREAIKDLKNSEGAAQEKAMINIVKYHQLIIRLRDETEALLRKPALAQVVFIVSSLGAQLIRLVFIGLPLSQAAFVAFYTGWVLGQLNTLCMRAESATQAGLSVSFAAYEAYETKMSQSVAQSLTIIMCRAQRPMKFTAFGIIVFNRNAFLQILKRCYSLFSALTNLRGKQDIPV